MTAVSVLRHLDYRIASVGRFVGYAGRTRSVGLRLRTYEGGCAEVAFGPVLLGICWR